MSFEEWYKTHWRWGSSTDQAKAKRAWDSARQELKPLLTRAADALEEYREFSLADELRKAAE